MKRAALVFLFLSGSGALALIEFNRARLQLDDFEASATRLLERYRAVEQRIRPDYQAAILGSLPPNPNNGDVIVLDDLLGTATITPGPESIGGVPSSEALSAFEFNDPQAGLRAFRGISQVGVSGGMLRIRNAAQDFLTNERELEIPGDEVGEIRIRARSTGGSPLRLGWSTEADSSTPWENALEVDLILDGGFHEYVIDASTALRKGVRSGERIRRIFLQPSSLDGAQVELDYVRFASKSSKYLRSAAGAGYESLAGEMRRVLYMHPGTSVRYSVRLPKEPMLRFGSGFLGPGNGGEFQVSIDSDGHTRTLCKERVTPSSQWVDRRIDLSAWSGRKVDLLLSVAGNPGQIAFWSSPRIDAEPARRLNVILLIQDALRADRLSVYGHARRTSPNLEERIQQGGVVFTHAFSQAAKTRPSLPSLMTSLLPTATGVWTFYDRLGEAYLTLPEILRRQGFQTAAFLQNGNAGPGAGLHQGFEQLFDDQVMGQRTEEILGKRLFLWLQENRDRNFFLYLHVMDPHGPYDPPSPFDSLFGPPPAGDTPVSFDAYLDPRRVRRPTVEERKLRYDQEVAHNDSVLRDLFRVLDEQGLQESTVVILTADHGEYLGEHGRWEHRDPGYRPVLHVPLVILPPPQPRAPRSIEENVQLLDLAPTILELSGVEASRLPLQGDSLLGLMEGRNKEQWKDRLVVSEEPVFKPGIGLPVSGSFFFHRWHFLASRRFWPAFLPAAAKLKVFDYQADPAEASPLALALPDLYLKYRLFRIMEEIQAINGRLRSGLRPTSEEDSPIDPEILRRLRALGYVD